MLIVVFGKSTISITQVQLCYNRFKEDREDVNDDVRVGRQSTSTINENIEAERKLLLLMLPYGKRVATKRRDW